MRERANDFIADGLGINTVYEISAIGARVYFYTLSQEQSTILEHRHSSHRMVEPRCSESRGRTASSRSRGSREGDVCST